MTRGLSLRTFLLWGAVLAGAGCNCGVETTSPDGGSSSMTYRCCLRGNYYACPDTLSLQNCAEVSAPSGCLRDRSKDSLCP